MPKAGLGSPVRQSDVGLSEPVDQGAPPPPLALVATVVAPRCPRASSPLGCLLGSRASCGARGGQFDSIPPAVLLCSRNVLSESTALAYTYGRSSSEATIREATSRSSTPLLKLCARYRVVHTCNASPSSQCDFCRHLSIGVARDFYRATAQHRLRSAKSCAARHRMRKGRRATGPSTC